MTIDIPTFITKEAVVRPDLLAETPDPKTDVTHAEWNALTALARETAEETNGLAAAIGEMTGGVQAWEVRRRLLFELPIRTSPSPVLEPVYLRGTGDTGSPSGTQSISLQTALSDPSRNVLRLSTDAGVGWIWPIDLEGVVLPESGYVLEVEIARYPPSTWFGIVAPLLDVVEESGVRVARGLYLRSYNGAVNIDWMDSRKNSGPYAHVQEFSHSPTLVNWPSTPSNTNLTCGPYRMTCEVRRTRSQTPARWSMRYTVEGIGQVLSASISGVSAARTTLDGRALDHIGVGIYGGAGDLDIQGLRVLALP